MRAMGGTREGESHCNGLAMLTRPIAFPHVRYNLRVPAEEDLFGDPAAGPEQRAGKGVAAAGGAGAAACLSPVFAVGFSQNGEHRRR